MGTKLFAQRPQRLLVIDARPPNKVTFFAHGAPDGANGAVWQRWNSCVETCRESGAGAAVIIFI
jgi:hypothetical protein